jgi:hypothetical protein
VVVVTNRRGAVLASLDAAGDLDASLDVLCQTSTEALGISGAAVALLLAGDDPCSLASSDERALQVVELQFSLGEGPCIDAHDSGRPVLVANLVAATRWPIFANEAVTAGAAAVFALPLQVGAAKFGVLTLYRDRAGSLGPGVLADALAIADVACEITLCFQAQVPPGSFHQVIDDLVDQRTVVYQATGMVLRQLGVSPEAALATLRARSYAEGRRLGEVSADVVARRLRFDV